MSDFSPNNQMAWQGSALRRRIQDLKTEGAYCSVALHNCYMLRGRRRLEFTRWIFMPSLSLKETLSYQRSEIDSLSFWIHGVHASRAYSCRLGQAGLKAYLNLEDAPMIKMMSSLPRKWEHRWGVSQLGEYIVTQNSVSTGRKWNGNVWKRKWHFRRLQDFCLGYFLERTPFGSFVACVFAAPCLSFASFASSL